MFTFNKIKHANCFYKNLITTSSKRYLLICNQDDLLKVMQQKIDKERERITKFKKEHGKTKIGEITVGQLYGGMRGMLGFVCDTSFVDPEEGIRFRGFNIPEVQEKMPKAECGKEPLPEGIFLLLLTGEIPCKESVEFLSRTWAKNSKLPEYAEKIIKSLPKDLHPMTQLSMAVSGLNKNSEFNKAYEKVPRTDYWKYALADAMDLLAKIPTVAAMIYRNSFKNGQGNYEVDPCSDWSANFAKMLGYCDPNFSELLRLYLTIHCDHEGGNVSAHACHLVGSALSDPYISYAAALNGLAGPLHGRANQEVLLWLDQLIKVKGVKATEQDIKDFCQDKEKQYCRIIPGYGHAVLRQTDPRFTCQMQYAQRVIPDDPLVKLVATVYKAVPVILKGLGKVSNPWPNVDANSGVLLRHFGLNEASYYTVLFGISRALGSMAQFVWARALMMPIERPLTLTTDLLMKKVAGDKKKEK